MLLILGPLVGRARCPRTYIVYICIYVFWKNLCSCQCLQLQSNTTWLTLVSCFCFCTSLFHQWEAWLPLFSMHLINSSGCSWSPICGGCLLSPSAHIGQCRLRTRTPLALVVGQLRVPRLYCFEWILMILWKGWETSTDWMSGLHNSNAIASCVIFGKLVNLFLSLRFLSSKRIHK